MRLYLPRAWLSAATDRQLAGIPEEDREPTGKPELALRLLNRLLIEGRRPKVLLGAEGYSSSHEFVDAVASLGLVHSFELAILEKAQLGSEFLKDHLGMDHFEGRSWRGWHHHAASVLTAYSFLLRNVHRR